MNKQHISCLAGLVALFTVSAACGGIVVFEENFTGQGDPLNGKTPDVTTGGEAWEAGDEWGDDGIHFSPTVGGQAAHLNYTPQPGRVYTLSTRVRNPHANAFAFGFLPATPSAGSWTAEDILVQHNNAPGLAWVRTGNSAGPDQAAYLGPGVDGAQAWNGDQADPLQFIDFEIVLDTTADTWTSQWLINGVSQGPASAFLAPGNPGIGGVGMSREPDPATNSTFIETRYFRLTSVPEPSSLTLLAMSSMALTRRRR